MPRARWRDSLNSSHYQVEERVEALHRRCRAVGYVEGTGNVELPALELLQETLEEVAGQPDVGVEEDQDVPLRTPATQVPPAGHGGRSRQHLHESEPSQERDGTVCGTRIDDQHLVRFPYLVRHVGEQGADVALL